MPPDSHGFAPNPANVAGEPNRGRRRLALVVGLVVIVAVGVATYAGIRSRIGAGIDDERGLIAGDEPGVYGPRRLGSIAGGR